MANDNLERLDRAQNLIKVAAKIVLDVNINLASESKSMMDDFDDFFHNIEEADTALDSIILQVKELENARK